MFVEKFANDRIGIVEIESERYFFAIIKRYKEFKIKDQWLGFQLYTPR